MHTCTQSHRNTYKWAYMIHVHVHTFIHIYMHIHIQHIGTNAHRLKCYMHICPHTYPRSCMLQSCMTAYMFMHICTHAFIHTWVSICTRMSSYIYFNRSEVDIQTCLNTCMYAYKHPYLRTCMNIRLSESTCANKHMCTQYISILAKAKSIHLNQEDAQMHTWVSAHMHTSKWYKQTCYLQNYLHLQDCM